MQLEIEQQKITPNRVCAFRSMEQDTHILNYFLSLYYGSTKRGHGVKNIHFGQLISHLYHLGNL